MIGMNLDLLHLRVGSFVQERPLNYGNNLVWEKLYVFEPTDPKVLRTEFPLCAFEVLEKAGALWRPPSIVEERQVSVRGFRNAGEVCNVFGFVDTNKCAEHREIVVVNCVAIGVVYTVVCQKFSDHLSIELFRKCASRRKIHIL
jgi:hypothetical protein